jgi:hypothetical protein
MEALRIEKTDDSPEVILDQEGNFFEISGKSLPEDVVQFYQPVLDWLDEYRKKPKPFTRFHFKLSYFNTASSKLILDILLILEEMKEEGNGVLVKWISLASDEDMQEAGREYQKIVDVPFEHATYDLL